MRPLRLGLISFVNTLPLIRGLEVRKPEGFELIYDRPSALADRLRHGELDCALIPVVEFFRGVGDAIVPDLCIASDGPVGTIRFIARKPLREIRSVLVDKSSRSSVAMLRLLLRRTHDIEPDFHIYDVRPDAPFMTPAGEKGDAVLIIGDLAMDLDPGDVELDVDLGDWWHRSFHRPFVYAVWAWREREDEKIGERLTSLLHESYQLGLEEMDILVEEAAVGHNWSEDRVRRYLSEQIQFELDSTAIDGLRLFHRLCLEDHLAPHRLSVEGILARLGESAMAMAAPAP